MEHITTFTGEDFAPLTPNVDQIQVEDIAHALSLICRANGHFSHFFSVAQHSINCANEAKARGFSKKIQLACLLHDASEAYLSDITRPVKKHLPKYLEIEKHLQNIIFKKFLDAPLSEEEYARVRRVDDDMLIGEFAALMGKRVFNESPEIISKVDYSEKNHYTVENMFLRLAHSLATDQKQFTVLGIDGCHDGWCVVALDSLGNSSMYLIKHIGELSSTSADRVVLDIPIGLIDAGEERDCDKETRKLLGARRSSVFPVPCRRAVEVCKKHTDEEFGEARRINKELTGRQFSKQTWEIVPKILEVDTFLRNVSGKIDSFFESHPELCFASLLGKPCRYPKKAPQGEKERIEILEKHMDISNMIYDHDYSVKQVARDDIVDAAVLALTGLNSLENGSSALSKDAPTDSVGLKMRMLVANKRN